MRRRRVGEGQPGCSCAATCARTRRSGKLTDELQMLSNQRRLNPRHSSPWFPTKIRNNKNPFKTFNVFSCFLQFPSLPRCFWFLWHQNRSSLWKRSSSALLFLEEAGAAVRSQSAVLPGPWIVRGRKRPSCGRGQRRDLLTPLLARAGWQDICSLCTHTARPGADFTSVSFAASLRSGPCSLSTLLVPCPALLHVPPAFSFRRRLSVWRAVLRTGSPGPRL